MSPSEKMTDLGEPIIRSLPMEASHEEVWRVISSPGNLEDCHPFCKENPVERWPGVGARDRVVYYSGLVLIRNFTSWREGEGYDLDIGPIAEEVSKVQWRIAAEGDTKSTLTISIQPYRGRGERRDERLRTLLGDYLDSVLKGFAFFIATGQPVVRNQFGSHRMFSPAESAND